MREEGTTRRKGPPGVKALPSRSPKRGKRIKGQQLNIRIHGYKANMRPILTMKGRLMPRAGTR